MEQIGANKNLPVGHLFKHPYVAPHDAEYSLTMNWHPEVKSVKVSALRPTQHVMDEGYLHKEDGAGRSAEFASIERRGPEKHPSAIKDSAGRYRLVDGHHRVARAGLNGAKSMKVAVYDSRVMS